VIDFADYVEQTRPLHGIAKQDTDEQAGNR
jgi:hypothetical protein